MRDTFRGSDSLGGVLREQPCQRRVEDRLGFRSVAPLVLGLVERGIGLLAQNLQIPIVPIRIGGVWQMKQQRRRFAGRRLPQ